MRTFGFLILFVIVVNFFNKGNDFANSFDTEKESVVVAEVKKVVKVKKVVVVKSEYDVPEWDGKMTNPQAECIKITQNLERLKNVKYSWKKKLEMCGVI